jgi:HKD family nuclease
MTLRDLALKHEYRSDKDDLLAEFFVPCLTNSIQYDRAIEFISIKSLSTLAFGLAAMTKKHAKIRLISGHRFSTSDLEMLKKIYQNGYSHKFNGNMIRDSKMSHLQKVIKDYKIQMKVAIPNSELVDGSFEERIGIFRDENDDAVAFTGTSNVTFDAQNRNFESIDVFTSWDDKSRIDTKIENFEKLWNNETQYVQMYDLMFAEKNNLLKYTTEWAVDKY